jgi:GNAT superfamily N-acetyltransferase
VQPYTIRVAGDRDIPLLEEVERLAEKAFVVLSDYVLSGNTVPQALLQEMAARQMLWVATSDDDRPIGFVACREMESLLYVHEISVAFEHQKKGVGRRLMERVIDHAIARNYSHIGLTTNRHVDWNKPFYATLGFSEIGDGEEHPELWQHLLEEIKNRTNPGERCAMVKKVTSD